MVRRLLLFILAVSAFQVSAQTTGRVTKYKATVASDVVLTELEDKYGAQVANLEAPNPDANFEKRRLREIKAEMSKRYPHKAGHSLSSARKTTAATPPVVSIGFISDSLPGIPPDNDMCVSDRDSGIAVMNSRMAFLDTRTGYMVKRYALKSFSNAYGAGLTSPNDYRYDPKVIYDPEADRYICVMLNSTNELNYIVVGFSGSNSPSAKWTFYKFYGNYKGDTSWFDYPAIAITKDEFFLTGNKIKYNASWQSGFVETVIYQINKADGYAAKATLDYQVWDSIGYNGKNIRNLFPVKSGSYLTGPEQYFLSNRNFDTLNDTVFIVKVPGTIASGNQNLTLTPMISPVSYGVPPNGRQPDTSVVLATNDGRILGAYALGDEIQFVSASIDTSNGASGIFHGKISNYKTSPFISHAKIFSVDTLDFGYPNISSTFAPWHSGLNSIISFNYTGPNTFPGLAAISYDGTDYSQLVKIKTGDNSIKVLGGKEQRWGDYTGSQLDYKNYGAVWVVGIYGRSDNDYGNWMAKLNGPFVGVNNVAAAEKQSRVYPNPAFQFLHFEFNNPEQQALSFFIYDVQGKVVDKMLQQMCKKGQTRIQFNVASLPAGTYYLKAANDKGTIVMTEQFLRN
ncbi:MAG: T9SS type A sorting domain-containing protein [Sphingobacteriales bacterium]|nr:MAG: T9SS type A sorting domain-containing protein [Sphingobacteriales bacterium]